MEARKVYEALEDILVPRERSEIEKDLSGMSLGQKYELWLDGKLDVKFQPLISKFYDRMIGFLGKNLGIGTARTVHRQSDGIVFNISLKNRFTMQVTQYEDEPKDLHIGIYNSNNDRIHQEWINSFKRLKEMVKEANAKVYENLISNWEERSEPETNKLVKIYKGIWDILNADPNTYEPFSDWAIGLINPGKYQTQMMDLYYKYYLKFYDQGPYQIEDLFNVWGHKPTNQSAKETIDQMKSFLDQYMQEIGIRKLI